MRVWAIGIIVALCQGAEAGDRCGKNGGGSLQGNSEFSGYRLPKSVAPALHNSTEKKPRHLRRTNPSKKGSLHPEHTNHYNPVKIQKKTNFLKERCRRYHDAISDSDITEHVWAQNDETGQDQWAQETEKRKRFHINGKPTGKDKNRRNRQKARREKLDYLFSTESHPDYLPEIYDKIEKVRKGRGRAAC